MARYARMFPRDALSSTMMVQVAMLASGVARERQPLTKHDPVPPHSESAASTTDHAAPGPDGHSDDGGVGSSATTIVGN